MATRTAHALARMPGVAISVSTSSLLPLVPSGVDSPRLHGVGCYSAARFEFGKAERHGNSVSGQDSSSLKGVLGAAGGRVQLNVRGRFLAWITVGASFTTVLALGAVMGLNSAPRTFDATASGDTYLSSFAPASNHGTATILWVSSDGDFQNWTLIKFDISGLLRPGDLVVNAKMRLTVGDSNEARWPVVITTGRTLTAWQENGTTFSTAPLFAFDTSTATAVGLSGAPSRGTIVWIDVTKQLHRWHSYGGPSNFGTVIKIGPDAGAGSIGFASRENPELNKPVLAVAFAPGPRTPYGYDVGSASIAAVVARNE